MARFFGLTTFLVALLLLVPAGARSQNRDGKKGTVVEATPQEYAALQRVNQISGIIVSASGGTVTIRVDSPRLAPGGKGRAQVVHTYKEYELNLADKVVIQKKFAAFEFDDKGVLKFDENQKKELSKKGYIAIGVGDIKSGNIGTLSLSPDKIGGKDEGAARGPKVTKIVLTAQGTTVEPAKGPEKKKKN